MFKFLRNEESPTFMEYGLLITVIALVVLAGAAIFGESVAALFEDAGNSVPDP